MTSIGFQMDSNWMYTGTEDGIIKIFDLRSKTNKGCEREIILKDPINSMDLAPNEGYLVIGDQAGNLKIYDLAYEKVVQTIVEMSVKKSVSKEVGVKSVGISSNGKVIVCADSSGFWKLYLVDKNEVSSFVNESGRNWID